MGWPSYKELIDPGTYDLCLLFVGSKLTPKFLLSKFSWRHMTMDESIWVQQRSCLNWWRAACLMEDMFQCSPSKNPLQFRKVSKAQMERWCWRNRDPPKKSNMGNLLRGQSRNKTTTWLHGIPNGHSWPGIWASRVFLSAKLIFFENLKSNNPSESCPFWKSKTL